MSSTRRNIAVIGLGIFGTAIAEELARLDHVVLGVDIDESRAAGLAEALDSTIIADAADRAALQQCGLPSFDTVVITIGQDMKANLQAVMNALDMGCENVWVKAQDDTHCAILERLGVTRVLYPEKRAGIDAARAMLNPEISHQIPVGEGQFLTVVEVPKHRFGERSEDEPRWKRLDIRCLGVLRGDKTLAARPDVSCQFVEDDRAILIGDARAIERFMTGD